VYLTLDSIIPVRTQGNERESINIIEKLFRSFDLELYNHGNLVEMVFSILKGKAGEFLNSRKYRFQIKKLRLKLFFTTSLK